MIRFRTLGGVDLRDAEGRELRSVLAQPKRLALLAYLAIATPPGYHRRDTVLALFWPELDQERARGALRQAVHFLRRTLGAHMVQGHGGEDIGLAGDMFWCDVRAFDDALARGAPAEAIELYGGDLLDGFFVSDASPDFEAWLDHERTRVRQRAIEAAWSLTDQHAAAGRGADAARWARWAAARAPDDERTQRRLVALLDRLGDRTGALRAYEQFARRTRAEFDAEPSAETRALVASIRARDTVTAQPEHPAEPAVPPAEPAPTRHPPPVEAATHSAPPSRGVRRSRVLAVGAALCSVVITAYTIRSAHALAPSDAAGDSTAARSFAPATVVTTASPVARGFFEAGLRALFDRGDARLARSLFIDALDDDTTFAMAAFYVARCDAAADLAADATTMMARAMRLAPYASERERLIIHTRWATMVEDPDRMEIAESLATRYPDEPEGHIALATALVGMGDFLGAVPHLRRVIDADTHPNLAAPPLCTSCIAFHDLVDAYLLADSLAAAERVAREWMAREPRSTSSLAALRDVLARAGRARDAIDAERRLASLDPSEDADIAAAIIASHADDWTEADRLMTERVRYGSVAATESALWWLVIVRRNEGRLNDALAIARQFERFHGSQPDPQIAGLAEAQVLFEQARPREAARIFDSLAALPPNPTPTAPGSTARHRSWFLTHAATAWAAAGDTVRLARLADAVEGSARLSAYGRDWRLPHYLRGLLWNARGDRDRALQELERSIWSPSDGYTRANVELARAWLAAGRPHDAVSILQAALRGPIEASNFYVTRTEIHELLARSFDASGQPDSAAAHYGVVARSWHDGDAPFRQRAAAADAARARLTKTTPPRRIGRPS